MKYKLTTIRCIAIIIIIYGCRCTKDNGTKIETIPDATVGIIEVNGTTTIDHLALYEYSVEMYFRSVKLKQTISFVSTIRKKENSY